MNTMYAIVENEDEVQMKVTLYFYIFICMYTIVIYSFLDIFDVSIAICIIIGYNCYYYIVTIVIWIISNIMEYISLLVCMIRININYSFRYIFVSILK